MDKKIDKQNHKYDNISATVIRESEGIRKSNGMREREWGS